MIEIMPETENNTLVIKASEMLTTEDYETVFIPQLEQLIKQFGKIRVVIFFAENFSGWTLGAVWDDAVFGLQHRHDFEKVAAVGEQKWIAWAIKVGAYFMDGEVATYTPAEFKNAVDWVKK